MFLGDAINFVNAPSGIAYLDTSGNLSDFTLQTKVLTNRNDAEQIADALINNLVVYSKNSEGKINSVTFAANDDDAELRTAVSQTNAVYDASVLMLGNGTIVDENTLVFFIGNNPGEEITYGTVDSVANINMSGVGKISELQDGKAYDYVSFNEDLATGNVGVVVMMNCPYERPDYVAEGIAPQEGNYAYVINAQAELGTWGAYSGVGLLNLQNEDEEEEETPNKRPGGIAGVEIEESIAGGFSGYGYNVRLQLLDNDGEIKEVYFGDAINFVNAPEDIRNLHTEDTPVDFELDRMILSKQDAAAIADAIKNNLIIYSENSKGEICGVGFAASDGSGIFNSAESGTAAFNASDSTFTGGAGIDENTLVFHIVNNGTSLTYGAATSIGNKDASGVNKITSLEDGKTYEYYAFDKNSASGKVAAVVCMNSDCVRPDPVGIAPQKGNYAYVINAQAEIGIWGSNYDIRIQLLNKESEVEEILFGDAVKFINAPSVIQALDTTGTPNDFTFLKKNLVTKADAVAVANSFINNLIIYSKDDDGELGGVAFAANSDEAYFRMGVSATNGEYDESTMTFDGGGMVNSDTKVFYIANDYYMDVVYGGVSITASATRSSVRSVATLADGVNYTYYAFDEDLMTGEAGAVVLMNTSVSVSRKDNIAVISDVGVMNINGDTAYLVDYYMNGELKTATTMVDMDGDYLIANAKEGDVFNMTVDGDTILVVENVLGFNGYTYYDIADAPGINYIGYDDHNGDFAYNFGIISKMTGSRVSIVPYAGTTAPTSLSGIIYKNISDANIYVYDSNLNRNKLRVGSTGDIWADSIITSGQYNITVDGTTVQAPDVALGMLNSIFVKTVDNKVIDVVVYIAPEYRYTVA